MRIIISIISILLVLMIFGCDSKKTTSTINKVRLGLYNGEASLLLMVAKDQKFYEKYGLDVEIKLYKTGKHAVEALLNGEVDFADCTEFVIVKNSFKRDDFKILSAITDATINGILAKKSSNIKTPYDLKGKNIGTTTGTLTEYFTGVFLDQYNMTLKDVNLYDVKVGERYGFVDNPNLDALFAWEPYTYNLRHMYPYKLSYFPIPYRFPFFFVLTTLNDYYDKNPNVSEKVLRAVYDAEKWVKQHDKEIVGLIKNRFKQSEDYARNSIEQHNFNIFFPYTLLTMMENQSEWLVENNLVDSSKVVDYSKFFDTTALKKVKPTSITIIE